MQGDDIPRKRGNPWQDTRRAKEPQRLYRAYRESPEAAARHSQIASMSAQGVSTKDIAAHFGITEWSVDYAKRRALQDSRVTASERERRMMELINEGKSQAEVARIMGTDKTDVRRGSKKAIRAVRAPGGKELQEVMYAAYLEDEARFLKLWRNPGIKHTNSGKPERLDPATGEPMEDVTAKQAAAEGISKVHDRIARLLGADAPRKSVTLTGDMDSQIQANMDMMLAALAAKAENEVRLEAEIEALRAQLTPKAIEGAELPLNEPESDSKAL